jgi:hypothetical protein
MKPDSLRALHAGAVPYLALGLLFAQGGALSLPELARQLPMPNDRPSAHYLAIVEPLLRRAMVTCGADRMVRLTPSGTDFARTMPVTFLPPRVTAPAGPLVPARTAPQFREMAPGAMRVGGPCRPGMDDYKQIPSLFCGRRIVRGDAVE